MSTKYQPQRRVLSDHKVPKTMKNHPPTEPIYKGKEGGYKPLTTHQNTHHTPKTNPKHPNRVPICSTNLYSIPTKYQPQPRVLSNPK